MAIGSDIVVTENVASALKQFGGKFRTRAATEMNRFGQSWVGELVSKRLSGRPGVNRRTGNLARSFKARVFDSALLNGVVLDVQPEGPGAAYADLQEFGGTITPKKAKYLWIPIAGNLTPAGVARITPTEAINRGGFFAKGVFFGKPIVGKSKATAKPVPLFVLKKSVTVPGRMGAMPLWEQSMPSLVQRLDAVATSIAGGA